jgi:hypothetical protein
VADVPFVLRMVVQSVLPGSPPDLTAEGTALSAALQATVPATSDVFTGLSEGCPACKAEVQLLDITGAVCPNGHTWRESLLFHFPRHVHIVLNHPSSPRRECYSTLLDNDLHPGDAARADVRGVQPQGAPPARRRRQRLEARVGRRGAP